MKITVAEMDAHESAYKAAMSERDIAEDVRLALAEVYTNPETMDAEALLDNLEDRGLRVVRVP